MSGLLWSVMFPVLAGNYKVTGYKQNEQRATGGLQLIFFPFNLALGCSQLLSDCSSKIQVLLTKRRSVQEASLELLKSKVRWMGKEEGTIVLDAAAEKGDAGWKVFTHIDKCCCGLQAKTTYWPGLDQAWSFISNQCLVSENHLSGTVCLVRSDSALMAIDQHRAGLLQVVKSQKEEHAWIQLRNYIFLCVCICCDGVFAHLWICLYRPAILIFKPIFPIAAHRQQLIQIAFYHFRHIHPLHETRDMTEYIFIKLIFTISDKICFFRVTYLQVSPPHSLLSK